MGLPLSSTAIVASEGLHSGARARIITLVTGVRRGRCLATLALDPAGATKAGVRAASGGVKQALGRAGGTILYFFGHGDPGTNSTESSPHGFCVWMCFLTREALSVSVCLTDQTEIYSSIEHKPSGLWMSGSTVYRLVEFSTVW